MFYVQRTDKWGNRSIVHKSTTLSGAVRKMNGFDAREAMRMANFQTENKYIVLNQAEYDHYYSVMVERTNLMSGKTYMERRDTPLCCSPSSETYWSM